MEEQYEAIDKIINKVLETNLATATGHVVTLLREVAKAALEEGYKAGYENGLDEGNTLSFLR
jgi:hypothetical protein